MRPVAPDERIHRANLVLRTIRAVDRLLVKEKDPDRLLQGICDALVKNRGYYNAWIAVFDDEGELSKTSEAGLGDDFAAVVERMGRKELMTCCRKALSRQGIVVTDDPVAQCTDCPLAADYHGRGAMTVRLEHDGKVYGVLSVSSPLELTPDREEHGLLEGVAEDIAFGLHRFRLEDEHRRADRALQESEKRFRDLVENALTGILILQEGKPIYINPEQERLLGIVPRDAEFPYLESVHPEDVEGVREFFTAVTDKGGDLGGRDLDYRQYPIGRPTDQAAMKWIHCRASTIMYGENEALLVNMMDVTRAKQLEEMLRVQDKMISLGHVAAGIAHEIRNPLSGINIYLKTLEKMLQTHEKSGQVDKILAQLQSASDKIEAVIRRVMDFSKPTAPKFKVANISAPIEEAIDLCAVTLRKRGIKLTRRLSEALPPCKLDSQSIEEVILNLMTNATEAMRDKEGVKIIEVETAAEHDRVMVRVSDSGPGVPFHLREKVFDPFFTTSQDSTGIGLSISRRIITDHGGTLEVRESKWGGAQFVIGIPSVKDEG
jgi:PAS domain S-box-containing protein